VQSLAVGTYYLHVRVAFPDGTVKTFPDKNQPDMMMRVDAI
jgi:hypothetical protein